jgi:PAS domain S-box-containing protein
MTVQDDDGAAAGGVAAPTPAPAPLPDADAARLRGMVAGLNAIVWERDPVTWAIRYVNDRIEEVLGYPAARWLADPDLWFTVLHPEDREPTVAAVQRALVADQDFAVTYRVRAADGRTVWLRHLGHVTRDAAGRPVAGHAVLIDITAEQRREHAAALLAEAGRVLAAPGRVEERLTAVAALAAGELGERASVWLRTDDRHFRAVAAAPEHDLAQLLALAPITPPPALEGALRAGAPFVVPEVTGQLRRTALGGGPRAARLGAGAPTTVLVAPLRAGGQVVGLLTLSSPAGHRYDDADLRLAGELGQRIATMVDAERLAARQRAAHEITVALSAAGTVAEAAARLATGLQTELSAELVTVCTVGRDGHLHVEHVAGDVAGLPEQFPPIPLGAGVPLAEAARTHRAVWLADRAAWEQRYPEVLPQMVPGTQGGAVLPLAVGDRVLGAVGLTFPTAREFPPAERSFLIALAGQAAVAFERAALADTRQEVAETLQHSLLPRRLPELDRLVVTARYLPGQRGTAAGGDWYDVLPLPDGRVALAVGDVVGNGAAAAAVMGQLRSSLATLLLEGHPPARALELLDRFAAQVEGARVSTAACLLLDPATGRLTYSRAGHPPPLVVDPAGTRLLDDALGPALDLPAGTGGRSDATTELVPGSTLLLYTDGLVERRGTGVDAGLARMSAVADELRALLPGPLVDGLLAQLLDGSGPADDIAVVAARLVPGPLELDLPADPVRLRALRRAVHAWGADTGLRAELVDDLLLAVGEAAANAVEHAYPPGRPGRVAIRLAVEAGTVAATVRDEGTWRPPPPDPGFRGRGLQMIRGLGDDVSVDPGPVGTTVRFRLRLPPRATSPAAAVPPGAPVGLPAEVQVSDVDGSRCVQVLGELDLAGVAAVREPLLSAVAEEGATLDLTGVAALCSVGLGLLVEVMASAPGPLRVLLPPAGPARRALDLTGLTPLLATGTGG